MCRGLWKKNILQSVNHFQSKTLWDSIMINQDSLLIVHISIDWLICADYFVFNLYMLEVIWKYRSKFTTHLRNNVTIY